MLIEKKLTCRCQHCPQELEFEAERSGEMVTCPACGSETTLAAPPLKPAAAERPPDLPTGIVGREKRVAERVDELSTPAGRGRTSAWVVVFFCLIGMVLVLVGCAGEIDESTKREGSAIREAVYAIQYCSGFIVLAFSAVLHALRRMQK